MKCSIMSMLSTGRRILKYSENLPELFKAAKFTDIQIKAYREARNYVCKNMEV